MLDVDDDAEPMLIDLDSTEAVEALVRLRRNLAPDVEPGRPMAAMYDPWTHAVSFLTRHGLFESFYGARAERLVGLDIGGGEVAELTTYVGGWETDRIARPISDLGRS